MVFVDELSAFDGDGLCAGFERGRSAGVRFLVATQSLSNLATAGGDKLLHAALDNAELLVIHRQAVPDAAETLAATAGTEETWEHTHKVSDAAGLRIGWDETGDRARRLTERFRAHPNLIKSLGQGEAVTVTQRPGFAVRRITVRPALSRPRPGTAWPQRDVLLRDDTALLRLTAWSARPEQGEEHVARSGELSVQRCVLGV
jgi:type IV secretory pathway TraG/TraD family ATPase VirD4